MITNPPPTKTLICTTSTLQNAEELVDSLRKQASLMKDFQRRLDNFSREILKALNAIEIRYIEPPNFIYVIESHEAEGNFKVWRIES